MAKLYQTKIAQIPEEIDGFIALLQAEGVKSYLEIGSQYGGSLYKVASSLPKGSRIVSVDLPHPDHFTMMPLRQCIEHLALDYDVRLFLGDSTSPMIVEGVRALGPFDAIFIDGNHTLPYVTQDWEHYGPWARMVAFHDIVWDRPVRKGRLPIEVSKLWKSLKPNYRHREFIGPGSEKGIGVLWRDPSTRLLYGNQEDQIRFAANERRD